MPFPENHEENESHYDEDHKLEASKREYYTRLAAKALHNTPRVKSVDGAVLSGELWVYIDATDFEEVLDEFLWLFGTTVDYAGLSNTEEFGPLLNCTIEIDPEEVIATFDVSDMEEYEGPFLLEDYIENEYIPGREDKDLFADRLPDQQLEGVRTISLTEESSDEFRNYHPTLEGEITRSVDAFREPDGSWTAFYRLQQASAATCYSAIRKAIDMHHRDNFGPPPVGDLNGFMADLEEDSTEESSEASDHEEKE